jgi:hypothetical protein
MANFRIFSRKSKIWINLIAVLWLFLFSKAVMFTSSLGILICANLALVGIEESVRRIKNRTSRIFCVGFFTFVVGVAVQSLIEQTIGEYDESIITALAVMAVITFLLLKRKWSVQPTNIVPKDQKLESLKKLAVATTEESKRERESDPPSKLTQKDASESPKYTDHLIKLVTKKSFFALLLAVVLVAGFWWQEIRPTLIKKECSWSTVTEPGKPAYAGRTQAEADELNTRNLKNNDPECDEGGSGVEYFIRNRGYNCQPTDYGVEAPTPAVPEKTYWKASSEREYEACLRHNGL